MKQNQKSLRASSAISRQTRERERESSSRLICHTTTSCHTEGEARSISKDSADNAKSIICHTERSEVSKNTNANVQNHLDISVSTKPQYDKAGGHSVISPSLAGGNSTYSPSAREGASRSLPVNKTICHTEALAEVSQVKQNRDISLSLNITKYPNVQNHLDISISTKPQYDNVKKSHNPKSRKLALSLAAASIIVSASLELAVADCVVKYNTASAGNIIDCVGTVSANYLKNFLNNNKTNLRTINLGRAPDGLTVSDDGTKVDITSSVLVIFRSVNAANTDFTITGSSNAGVLLPYTLGNHTENASNLRNLTIKGVLNNTSWGSQVVYREFLDVDIHAGTQITKLTNEGTITNGMAIYGGYRSDSGSIGDRSTYVGSIENNGTINKLHLGYHQFAGDFASILGSYKIGGTGTINTLNVYQATLSINSNADTREGKNGRLSDNATTWNSHKHDTNDGSEHISFGGNSFAKDSIGTIGEGAIRINIGEGVTDDTQKYLYKNLILGKDGGVSDNISYRNLRAGLGTAIHDKGDGFTLSADVATSYGSSMWRTLSLSYARRNIMVQNILDTMTTKTFHSDRYYNQEVELRLLQYDLSRLTNRSSKFAKHTRKNQKAIDKTRNKLARLTLEQSKGQNLDKGYNNFELIDQLDAIFIPYTGRRDWRVFLVPYAAHSYADMGASTATEWAGGAIGGVQRNLRSQGILTSYLAYEYAHASTEMLGAEAIMQTNALQGGLSYFKIFPIIGKVWEAHIKANGRVAVDMPLLSAQSPLPNIKFNLVSNKKGIATPLMWSLGAEVRGGLTFYQFKSNSYVSPEIGLSYDVLSPVAMKLEKHKYGLGGNEYYDAQYWHLPQLSASVKYYKVFGNTFRTNITAGLRYNILNKPLAHFRIGGLEGEGEVTLPAVYGNLALDAIWVVKKNHELSAGYSGVFFANKFGKNVVDKFNGVSTAINLKYAYWFGGSDYVTDADGNAISRKIVESKNSKKSKKPKKKPKKSKKKVYYIDG